MGKQIKLFCDRCEKEIKDHSTAKYIIVRSGNTIKPILIDDSIICCTCFRPMEWFLMAFTEPDKT